MSRRVVDEVYRRVVGSMARKAILAYCADRASDDGSGIYCSKVRIAREVECAKNTVIATMKQFVDEGLLVETGRRKRPNGFVYEYGISITHLLALPMAIKEPFSADDFAGSDLNPLPDDEPELPFERVQICTAKGAASEPQRVQPVNPNRPLTVLKPKDLSQAFDRFWASYPECDRKAAKKQCLEKFGAAVAGKLSADGQPVDPETIIAAVERFAAASKDPQFIAAPLVWLNQARWEAWGPGAAPKSKYGEMLDRARAT